MNFNLITLGGIAAAIGLIIDDAIVVVEAIYAKIASGLGRPLPDQIKPNRKRSTAVVIAELREQVHATLPTVEWDFPGILSDLSGRTSRSK